MINCNLEVDPPKRRVARGFLLVDAVVALTMAGLLILSITAAIIQFHDAQRGMAVKRAGERRLESTLLAMQTGGSAEKDVAVERLSDAAAPGHVWVRVSLREGETPAVRKLTLVGLVPADRLAERGTP